MKQYLHIIILLTFLAGLIIGNRLTVENQPKTMSTPVLQKEAERLSLLTKEIQDELILRWTKG